MRHTLASMADGWELGSAPGIRPRQTRVWLQRGRIGSGRETQAVHGATLQALRKLLLVQVRSVQSQITTYELTAAGRSAVRGDA